LKELDKFIFLISTDAVDAADATDAVSSSRAISFLDLDTTASLDGANSTSANSGGITALSSLPRLLMQLADLICVVYSFLSLNPVVHVSHVYLLSRVVISAWIVGCYMLY
jgi:hypothetical protein